MTKRKESPEYKKLIDASMGGSKGKGINGRYANQLFLDDMRNFVYATNGHILHGRRDVYGELNCLSAMTADNAKSLKLESDGTVSKVKDNAIEVCSIIPSDKDLADHVRIRVTIPAWTKSISKKEKEARVSIILGKNPILALGEGYKNARVFDAKYLAQFSGEKIDLCVPLKEKSRALVALPPYNDMENTDWFYLLMPILKYTSDTCKYVNKKVS